MSFVPPDTNERSLSEALQFIEDEDDCSRSAAWEQFRKMVPLSRRWLWSVLWVDRKIAPSSRGFAMVQPSENVGPFGGWEDATLAPDGKVRFLGSRPRAVKIAPWTYFLLCWRHHQPPAPKVPSSDRGTTAPETLSANASTDDAGSHRRRGEYIGNLAAFVSPRMFELMNDDSIARLYADRRPNLGLPGRRYVEIQVEKLRRNRNKTQT
jgi:hypothetical protein